MLADKVSERLREPMISSALTDEFGAMLREAGKHGQWIYRTLVPLHYGYGFNAEWIINTDGSLTLRLMNVNGRPSWEGNFRAPDCHPTM